MPSKASRGSRVDSVVKRDSTDRTIQQLLLAGSIDEIQDRLARVSGHDLPQLREVVAEQRAGIGSSRPARAKLLEYLDRHLAEAIKSRDVDATANHDSLSRLSSGLPHLDLYGDGLTDLVRGYLALGDESDGPRFLRRNPLLLTPVAAVTVSTVAGAQSAFDLANTPLVQLSRLLRMAEEGGVQFALGRLLVEDGDVPPPPLDDFDAEGMIARFAAIDDHDERVAGMRQRFAEPAFSNRSRAVRAMIENALAEALMQRYHSRSVGDDLTEAAFHFRRAHSASRLNDLSVVRSQAIGYFAIAARRARIDTHVARRSGSPRVLDRAEFWSMRALGAMTTPQLQATGANFTCARVLISLYDHHHIPTDGAWAVAMLWAATSLGHDPLDYVDVANAAGELTTLAEDAGDTGLSERARLVAEYASRILSEVSQ